MPVDPQLRSLNIDIPAQPEALVKLSLLLAEDDVAHRIGLALDRDAIRRRHERRRRAVWRALRFRNLKP